ncbi:hypothetical protein [Profundibacter sp.]
MTWDNDHEDIYVAMNLLDDAVQKRGHEDAVAGIEAWLNEEDQDRPDFRETLAQGVQDAISHAATINEGKATITIVPPGDGLIRFEWFFEDENSEEFEQKVINAIKSVLKGGG